MQVLDAEPKWTKQDHVILEFDSSTYERFSDDKGNIFAHVSYEDKEYSGWVELSADSWNKQVDDSVMCYGTNIYL